MQPNLFAGHPPKRPRPRKYESTLLRHDRKEFDDRLERLTYLNKVFPKNVAFGSDLETSLVFDEAKMAFINGELISTVLLAQAFTERWLQKYFSSKGLHQIGQRGLKSMTDYARRNCLLSDYLLGRLDEMRKKRNPFVHLKEYEHEHNLTQRMMKSIRSDNYRMPYELLLEDAKQALSLMYTILITRID